MIVLHIEGFRDALLRFEKTPDKETLVTSVVEAYAFDTQHQSYRLFQQLVKQALEQLRSIDEDYVMIISSYYRFDDACGDDDWRAIQIGSYLVNNGSYFRQLPDPENKHYLAGKQASALMEYLEEQGWRSLFREIIGRDRDDPYWPREFGLLRNKEGEFLVLGDSINGDRAGGIYQVFDSEAFEFVGFPDPSDGQGYECEVDDRVDQGVPIKWQNISAWADEKIEHWDQNIALQEYWRLRPFTTEIPDPVRAEALELLSAGNVLAAQKILHDGGYFNNIVDALAWTKVVKTGFGLTQDAPTYLKEAFAFMEDGNYPAATALFTKHARLTEREASNVAATYLDHLVFIEATRRMGRLYKTIRRAFFSWRR